METGNEFKVGKTARLSLSRRHLIFFLVLLALVGCAILRSSIATRFDSFTVDEAYHIGAGAAYFQTGDFRLKSEPAMLRLTAIFIASKTALT